MLGVGTETGDELVESLRAQADLSPDAAVEWVRLLAWNRHGRVAIVRTFGSALHEGGPFEKLDVDVALTAGDRVHHVEFFDAADAALARFAELCAERDLLRVPPNDATRAMEQFDAAVRARDWAAVERCFAPGFAYEDRRRGMRDSGDRAKMLASVRLAASVDAQVSVETLSTSGERVALQHILFTIPGGDAGAAEIETLQIAEVDEKGRLIATVAFDPDGLRAASLEMLERSASPGDLYDFLRGIADRDLARCRAALPDDFVCDDHRRTGMGRIEGADAYVASLAALFEQTREVVFSTLYTIARADQSWLAVARSFGELVDGGEFESVYLQTGHVESGRLRGVEFFELGDLERARARFAELCAERE